MELKPPDKNIQNQLLSESSIFYSIDGVKYNLLYLMYI